MLYIAALNRLKLLTVATIRDTSIKTICPRFDPWCDEGNLTHSSAGRALDFEYTL
jgi:hypothetical protein